MPIIKGGRIKIGVIGPGERMNLRVEAGLIEKIEVAQGAVIMAVQNRFKVDDSLLTILKNDPHCVGGNDFKIGYINQKVVHFISPFYRCRDCTSTLYPTPPSKPKPSAPPLAGGSEPGSNAEIARIGLKLNRLRIKRRIYDYVIEVV